MTETASGSNTTGDQRLSDAEIRERFERTRAAAKKLMKELEVYTCFTNCCRRGDVCHCRMVIRHAFEDFEVALHEREPPNTSRSQTQSQEGMVP